MIWETNPRKRNENNIVNINVPKNINLEKGDLILASYGNDSVSTYNIDEIINSRESSIKNMNYVSVKTSYKRENRKNLQKYNLELCSITLRKFIGNKSK